MRKILSFCMFLCQLPVFAQQSDSIPQHHADSALVLHSRRLLLDMFRAGRLDSVSMLADSLDRQAMPLLWPAERLLLYCWTEQYSAFDSLVWRFNEACSRAASHHPPDQTVWNVLSYHSLESIDTLVAWIDQSGCGDGVFNMRVRLLEYMLRGDWPDQASVNRGISAFVKQYFFSDNDRQDETVHADPQPAEPDDEPDGPWSATFGLGLGPASLSGNINGYLSAKLCLAIDVSVYYKRWRFSLLMHPVFGKLKRDIPLNDGNDTWEAGTSADIGNFGLALGYMVFNGKVFKLNPFIGFAVSECAPSQLAIDRNEALKDAGIRWGFSSICGLDASIRLCKLFDLPLSFNTRFNYVPEIFNTVNARYSGNLSFITFGFCLNVSSW